MIEALEKYLMIEYEANVTQLEATSEINIIGILLTVPIGDRILIIRGKGVADDEDVAINIDIRILNSSGIIMEFQRDAMDDTDMFIVDKVSSDQSNTVADQSGIKLPILLGGGQAIRLSTAVAIDAENTLKFMINYLSTGPKLVATAIGAGISISSEVHKQI